MFKFFKSFLDFNSREIARLKLSVAKINELGPAMTALTDDEMRAYTTKLQAKVQKEASSNISKRGICFRCDLWHQQ